MKCDNLSNAHNPEVIGEDNSALLVYCNECGATEVIGKDANGNPENLAYSEFFKRELLQPPSLLYYRYAGAKGMSVV